MTTISKGEILRPSSTTTIINAGERQGSREIRGAVRYRPTDLLEPDHLALPLSHDGLVILYAEHGPTERLREIAEKMERDGFRDVRVYDGTLADFENAGGVTQDPTLEQTVPPQRPDEVDDLDRRL
jgi:hypothetical protein